MILVIEDDKTINNLLCKVLSDSGYETDSAFDGEEGLYKALNVKCDLILLDLMLHQAGAVLSCLRPDPWPIIQ